MSTAKRIRQIAENEGITISEMERNIGASLGTLSRAANKGTDIQSKWVSKVIEKYQKYSPDWLLTGEGEMLRVEGNRNITQTANGNNNHQQVGQATSATEAQLKEQNKHLQHQLKELQDQNAKLINIITQLTAK